MAFQTDFKGPSKTEGGQEESVVADEDVRSLLNKILQQLRIMNIHLELITDESVDKKEVNNG